MNTRYRHIRLFGLILALILQLNWLRAEVTAGTPIDIHKSESNDSIW